MTDDPVKEIADQMIKAHNRRMDKIVHAAMTKGRPPVLCAETVEAYLRDAVNHNRGLDYRLSMNSLKRYTVDFYSATMLLHLLENVSAENKARLLALAPNVGKMALIALSAINRSDMIKGQLK